MFGTLLFAGPMLSIRHLAGPLARVASCPAKLSGIAAIVLCCVAAGSQAQISGIEPRSPLPDATINRFYSVRFTPVNAFQGLPVLWSITPGCLDGTGLAFTPQNGAAKSAQITGVARLGGTFVCTIAAQDAAENVFAKLYQLSIVRGCTTPRITSAPPPPTVDPGVAFTYTVLATGRPPRTFSALGLPPGLAIDPTTGVIAGTTQAAGTYAVTVIVTGCGRSAIQNFTLVVGTAPVALTLTSAPNPAVFGQDVTVSVHAAASASVPTGAVQLCVIAPGEFCAAPIGAPPPGTPANLIPALATATLDAAGNAAFTLRGLGIQNYVIQAYYGGDATHSAALSVSVDQFVIKGAVLPPPSARAGQATIAGTDPAPIPALSLPMLALLSLAIALVALHRALRRD